MRLGLVMVAAVHEAEEQVEVGRERGAGDQRGAADVPQLGGVAGGDGVDGEADEAMSKG